MSSRALRGIAAFVLAASACLAACPVFAQAPAPPPIGETAPAPQLPAPLAPDAGVASSLGGWNASLNRISARLQDPLVDSRALETARDEIEEIRARIESFIAEQSPRLSELEARLRQLGEAPKNDDPPEPQAVATQRAELRARIGDLSGAVKAAQEALLRSEDLRERVRDIRRRLFETRLFERGRSPLSPSLWRDIAEDAPVGVTRIGFMLSHWWNGLPDQRLFAVLLLAAAALWAGLSWLLHARISNLRDWREPEPPSEWRRAASAARVILLRSLPTVAAGGFFYFGLTEAGLLSPSSEAIVIAAIASLIIVTTVQAVAKTALAIIRPRWRLLTLSDRAARQLYNRLMLLAAVYGADFFISSVSQSAFMPLSVNIGQSFLSSILIAGLILSILRIEEEGASGPQTIGPAYVRLPLWLIVIAILGAALVGYVSLARFIAGQLIVTSTVLIIAYLLIIWVSALGQSMSEEKTVPGAWLRDRLGFDRKRRERIAIPIMLILKAAILIAAVPPILLLWGFDWQDVESWLRQALFGFQIGNVRISITAILVALLLFMLGYIAARLFQSWLDGYVLERAGVDPAVRHSIRTGVGYAGVALAAILAISYLGLDFSNLAIVAGALSVGIGFGLQSVVNNFVSGLILLAERPIKVGDWIIVGGQEGIVRKISVRSTEIETFDRANLIIPNSMLIADMVKNWTLHNVTGRMPIPVGVHYDSDPEKVRDVLLDVARRHPQVLSNPEPFVFFEDFGDSALKFILFVYLANVNRSFSVRTDLRMAILKAFRREGIEIPYPQADIHLRDLDWIKNAIAEGRRRSDGGTLSRRDYKSESEAPGEGDSNGV